MASVTYGYNGLDGLVAASEAGVDGAVTTTYGHDGRGRLVTVTRGGAPVVTYARRASGEPDSVTGARAG